MVRISLPSACAANIRQELMALPFEQHRAGAAFACLAAALDAEVALAPQDVEQEVAGRDGPVLRLHRSRSAAIPSFFWGFIGSTPHGPAHSSMRAPGQERGKGRADIPPMPARRRWAAPRAPPSPPDFRKQRVIERAPKHRLLPRPHADRCGRHGAAERQARPFAHAARASNCRAGGHIHQGNIHRGAAEFLEGPPAARPRRRIGEDDLDQQGIRERARALPGPGSAASGILRRPSRIRDNGYGIQGQQGRGQIRGGRAVRHIAAQRGHVADLHRAAGGRRAAKGIHRPGARMLRRSLRASAMVVVAPMAQVAAAAPDVAQGRRM